MNKDSLTLEKAIIKSLPKMLKNNNSRNEIVKILEEYINDNLDANLKIVETIDGKGSDDFPINIHEFHGIFWVSAPEFDDHGYFTSLTDAVNFAEHRYEPFITNYKENADNSY